MGQKPASEANSQGPGQGTQTVSVTEDKRGSLERRKVSEAGPKALHSGHSEYLGSLFGREGSSSIQGARVFGNILENGVTCVLFSTMSISGKGNGGGSGSRKRG